MRTVIFGAIAACPLALAAACTTIDDPKTIVPPSDAGPDTSFATGADGAVVSPCTRRHNWAIRGLPASFFPGPKEGTGAWGLGDYFKSLDTNETVIFDAYVAGTADELRGRRVTIGEEPNANLETLTNLFILRRGCDDQGGNCLPGMWVPVSGTVVVTRLEPRNGSSVEIHADKLVLRRATRKGSEWVFDDMGPDACEFYSRLTFAGATVAPSSTCGKQSYPECPFAANADQRHPK
ncbi:MAG: hypothetical protein QM702_21150 [Rubrivivax sp.]